MTKSVLLAYHSKTQLSTEILDHFNRNGFTTLTITEETPDKLSVRAQLIKSCDCLVVIASRDFQKRNSCMEVVHFAKDNKKEIFGIITIGNYKPFGGLGAILSAKNHVFCKILKPELIEPGLDPVIAEINLINSKNQNIFIESKRMATPITKMDFLKENVDILITYHSKTKEIADLIGEAVQKQNLTYKVEDSSCGSTLVKGVKVVVVIMTAEYEENYACRLVIQTARDLNFKIIPISITKAWKPTDWLALVTAGALFYRIFNREQAYKHKYDSTPMNDLVVGILTALSPVPNENEIEKQLIECLKKQIDECKSKLSNWPPKHRQREIPEEKPVKVELKEPSSDLEFTHIHTTVTRITFAPPPALYDNNGIPIRKKFDCNQLISRSIFI